MKMIVGLGNPGRRYENTRHNAGFIALDALSDSLGAELTKTKESAKICEINFKGEKVILVKPQTYMNLSGHSVGPLSNFYKILPADILVMHDDLDFELGKIKIKPGGGSGGHKGLNSIIQCLGTNEFNRLKIGIGRPEGDINPVDYVLGRFSKEELQVVEETLTYIVKAATSFIGEDNIDMVMNRYNV